MEHILQFAIGIDEDRIKEEIKRSAVNKISQELVDAAKKELGARLLRKIFRQMRTI